MTFDVDADIRSSIEALRRLAPTSWVLAWWDQEGRFGSYDRISHEHMPLGDQVVIIQNIRYTQSVLADAMSTQDVAVVTRLVSYVQGILRD